MSKKYAVVGSEHETEPGSNQTVLRNLVGITDPEEMDEAEAQAGLPILDFATMAGDGQERYFGAISAAWSKGDYAPLCEIFDEIVRVSLEAQ